MNWVHIKGKISLEPKLFSNNRAFFVIKAIDDENDPKSRETFIPCKAWDDLAKQIIGKYHVNDSIEIEGKITRWKSSKSGKPDYQTDIQIIKIIE